MRKKNKVQSPLDLHNISQYIEDYAIISKFSHLPFSKREWIETRRYELQWSASFPNGLEDSLKFLKSLSSQIAQGEITFSEEYKDTPSALKANMSMYASELMRIAALLEFLIIEAEEIEE